MLTIYNNNIYSIKTTLNLLIMLHILITIDKNMSYNLVNKIYTTQTIMSTFNIIYTILLAVISMLV